MSTLAELLNHRWSLAILAELERTRGSRFVVLLNRVGLSRESLRVTLSALLEAGLVARNPGYGHPLRPEYVLTPAGARIAARCAAVLDALRRVDGQEVGLKKWSLAVVLALSARRWRRFSELRGALRGITARALTMALKDLAAAGLVERTVTSGFPPATGYRLTPRAAPLVRPVRRLANTLRPVTA